MSKGFAYQIVINTTPEKVWESLTSPEFTRQYWFGRSVESTWHVGSDVTIKTPDGSIELRGKVLEAEKNRRLSYTWDNGTGEEPTTVIFEIIQMGPLVKLSILHDFDLAAKTAEMAANGWTFILCGLKTFLETGAPMPALPWNK